MVSRDSTVLGRVLQKNRTILALTNFVFIDRVKGGLCQKGEMCLQVYYLFPLGIQSRLNNNACTVRSFCFGVGMIHFKPSFHIIVSNVRIVSVTEFLVK